MGLLSTIGAASGRAFGFTRSAIAAATDAFFNRVTLLLPGNGTNGAQNNTFLDGSSNAFSITRNGNTTQGTFSPFSQTGWSNFFNAAATYIFTPSATPLVLSGGSWTIEAWAFCIGGSGYRVVLSKRAGGTAEYEMGIDPSGYFYYYTSTVYADTTTVPLNQWVHLAVTYDGTNLRMFQNGVLTRTVAGVSAGSGTGNLAISIEAGTGGQAFPGYISNVRITKGGALYTAGFTPSSSPLTTTVSSGTVSFLSCQSNRFVDNSSNAYPLTIVGTPSVQAFSPFTPTAEYSAATVGGSGYFDGTGDNLTVPTNAANSVGSGSFYFEAWVYLTNPSVAQMIIADPSNTGGLFVGLNIDGGSRFTIGRTAVGVDNLVTVTWIGNQWYHLAVNRNGTSLQFFVNGTQVGSTGTNSVNYPSVGYRVGAEQAAGSAALTGYISGLRLVKSSVNTTNFTPPTAPPDASTAALCLQFTNAGITDATAKNDLETVGNAQISTTQSKFGGSSMYFDGTGDGLDIRDTELLEFGSGNFTVEAWVRFAALPSNTGIAAIAGKWDGGSQKSWYMYIYNSGGTYQLYFSYTTNGSTNINPFGNTSITTNTWYHIAACRDGANLRLFVDGTQVGSTHNAGTDTIFGGTYQVQVGRVAGTHDLNGFIDDLRITKGYARYTANFTPPTAALPLQ